jgi:hypothetical protein
MKKFSPQLGRHWDRNIKDLTDEKGLSGLLQ